MDMWYTQQNLQKTSGWSNHVSCQSLIKLLGMMDSAEKYVTDYRSHASGVPSKQHLCAVLDHFKAQRALDALIRFRHTDTKLRRPFKRLLWWFFKSTEANIFIQIEESSAVETKTLIWDWYCVVLRLLVPTNDSHIVDIVSSAAGHIYLWFSQSYSVIAASSSTASNSLTASGESWMSFRIRKMFDGPISILGQSR